jgi:hypothetical protein
MFLFYFFNYKVYSLISNCPKFESILSSSKKDIDDHILSGQFSGH